MNVLSIPKGNRKTPCKFGKNYKETNYNRKYFNKDTEYTTLNETVLVDVLEFCINNAVSMLQGRLVLQTKGIPQGDNLSPAIAIGTAAWYEMLWSKKQNPETLKKIKIKRYMDDIFAIKIKDPETDAMIENYTKSQKI